MPGRREDRSGLGAMSDAAGLVAKLRDAYAKKDLATCKNLLAQIKASACSPPAPLCALCFSARLLLFALFEWQPARAAWCARKLSAREQRAWPRRPWPSQSPRSCTRARCSPRSCVWQRACRLHPRPPIARLAAGCCCLSLGRPRGHGCRPHASGAAVDWGGAWRPRETDGAPAPRC